VPVRIHALLDDASRYVVAIEARHAEREVDMLAVFIRALRRFGAPDALYLDNGSTYRGETLSVACARLGTALVHAKPYDAPARGKMERFWRTLRDQCLRFCGDLGSLHDLDVRLLAWLDEHYHKAPHGGLMGKTPEQVFSASPINPDELDECFFSSLETLPIRCGGLCPRRASTSLDVSSLAGFQTSTVGRFWVSTEASRPPFS
jgi:transposase InsO family protein